ncbi:hypothetical protein QMT40_000081 [Parvibaculaceae bacterium PLY_AMNH_Bact1]|nr:hypothetical protein QMT40_000081 [Parvibaculaceae bacterium PLY_AMNH_Bact1]
MVSRFLVTFGALVWGLGVPFLEINDTHVFNPAWTPHALIHEVWQLMTNTGLAGLVLWLTWVKREVIQSAIIGLLITGGFLFAFLIRNTYGGSMKYIDGSEKTVVGLNIGVVGFSIVAAGLVIAILLEKRHSA